MKTFEDNAQKKVNQLAKLVIAKQRDYGKRNILGSPIDPRLALIVRLNDKLSRAANLIQKGAAPENEALLDTWKDIMGYGLVGWMVEDDTFEYPMESEINNSN